MYTAQEERGQGSMDNVAERAGVEQALNILILEKSITDAESCARVLKRAGLSFNMRCVDTRAAFEQALKEFRPDLVISEFTLSGAFDGLAALDLARSKIAEVPFIFVSGTVGEDRAVEAIKRGATDFVIKDRVERLAPVIKRAIDEVRERIARRRAEEEIHAREARFQLILQNSLDAFITIDQTGAIIEWSGRAEAMFGWNREEVKGLLLSQTIIPERYRDAHDAGLRRFVQTGQTTTLYRPVEFHARRRNGTEFPVEVVVTPAKMQDRYFFSAFIRDITLRVKWRQRLDVQHAIARVLAGTVALEEVPSKLLQVTCENMGFTIGALWEVGGNAGALRCIDIWHVASPELEQFAAKTREMTFRPGMGSAGRAWESGAPVWIPDATISPRSPRVRHAAEAGLHENLAFPITVRGEISGIADFFGPEAREPEPELLEVFAAIGTQIGQFLERRDQQHKIARLNRIHAVLSSINSAIIRHRDRQELLKEACRIALEHGGFGIAWIGMLDPKTLEVIPAAWAGIDSEWITQSRNTVRDDIPLGQGFVGRAIREKRAVFSNDIATEPSQGGARRKEAIRRGYRSMIVLPLVVEGAAVGNFTLFAKEPNFFNEAELKLLIDLAGDISFALDNIARQQKLEKLSRIRMVSSEINAAIVRIPERRALLEETCRIASEQGRFEMVWIGAIDPERQEVQPVAWVGFSPEAANGVAWTRIGAGLGPIAEAIRTRKPVVRYNIISMDLPAGTLRQEAIEKGYLSSVCIPIEVDSNVAAIIILFAPGEGFFDEDELALLKEVAANVSLALQSISHQERLNYLAYNDALTGLPNRSLFTDRLEQLMHTARRDKECAAAVFVDTERFRHVNDTLGRSAGDNYLREVARRLQSAVREQDTVARIGADCFAVAVGGIAQPSDAAHTLVHRIVAAFREPVVAGGQELRVAFKAGIAVYPNDGDAADGLCANAEAALKKAKGTSERYLFYQPEMNAKVAGTLLLENKMRHAIEKEQFVLHYQPKVGLASGKISGLEALIRWNDPETGLVPPMQFIPLLEETGMILEAGRWAIRKALEDYRKWQLEGLQPLRIAVNVSPIQLRQKDFVDIVRNAISESGGGPHGLDLEITESVIMENIEDNIEKLRAIRDLGINIAIDDFGTGYSSLGYLAKLPVNALKIDRSFIITMDKGPESLAIVSTIISLANSLNLKVVAEGVDSEGQSRLLNLWKCDEIQGYLFSKPLPADILLRFLREKADQR